MSRHHEAIKNDPRYKAWRRTVIGRDGACTSCGTDEDLTADHVKPLDQGGEPFDPDNGLTLCRPCNSRKGNRTEQRMTWLNPKYITALF